MNTDSFQAAEKILAGGGVGVIPTDTLYGLVGRAAHEGAVERIYKLKNRRPDKPLIVLIGDTKDLELFGVVLDNKTEKFLDSVWPGPVSVILSAPTAPAHLLRGGTTIAFRLPKDDKLRAFLGDTGPLVVPSANPEGEKPAQTIAEARAYFRDAVDFYVDSGERSGNPSTLVSLTDGVPRILRGSLSYTSGV